jgi:uncharacterized membrane protein (Fun14 family)
MSSARAFVFLVVAVAPPLDALVLERPGPVVHPALRLRGGKASPPPTTFDISSLPIPDIGAAAGIGGIAGFIAGKAAKSVTETVAVWTAASMAVTALLSRAGYITIHYEKVEKDVRNLLDTNKDGKIDKNDYTFASAKIMTLLNENGIGSTAGFFAGFKIGFM